MASSISNIPGVGGINPVKQGLGGQSGATEGGSFMEMMKQGLGSAIDAQKKSEEVAAASLLGNASMTDVLQATNNAEIALNTVLAIRDRLVQAWQEIMRSQI